MFSNIFHGVCPVQVRCRSEICMMRKRPFPDMSTVLALSDAAEDVLPGEVKIISYCAPYAWLFFVCLVQSLKNISTLRCLAFN
ncbi:MAG: hypothetical protein DSZ23_00940 [Thermodesulfatator sp.]|nr:MAG: hypothetical protein DSZ23_00940 [Thermodesulfatator sp.]